MKHLIYGTSSILVGDDVASAVLHYATILAQAGESDVVDIPTVAASGGAAHASVVLGPGVPVMAVDAAGEDTDDAAAAFVADLAGRVNLILGDGTRRR